MRRRAALFSALVLLVGFGAVFYQSLLRGPAAEGLPSQAATQESPDAPDVDDLTLPIRGLKLSDILDTYLEARPGGRIHEAVDILASRGTPVRAVTDGMIRKLFLSKAGGVTMYQFDESEEFCFYYAHLDGYAEGLHEGQSVDKGDVIGYVGSSGNADPSNPHLHFAIFKLGPEKHWWKGAPINPYPVLQQLTRSSTNDD